LSNYAKGARTERELLAIFSNKGYSVIRSAGSGVNALSPDIIAVKQGKLIAVECKAWNKSSLALDKEQYEKLQEWQNNSGFATFVGWRMNGSGWYFIRLEEFEKGQNAYNITKNKVLQINRRLEDILY